jgi:O-antigen/teichoic acid export membrane protein
LTAAASTLVTVVIVAASQSILSMFGPQYAEHGRLLLVLITAASIPLSVYSVYVSFERSQRRFKQPALLATAVLILIVGLGIAFARLGALGPTIALGSVYVLAAIFVVYRWRFLIRSDHIEVSGRYAIATTKGSPRERRELHDNASTGTSPL